MATISANVDDQMAKKVRVVADKEHRSTSNVVSSALTVFMGLPKELRDTLLELQSSHDAKASKRIAREMQATVARIRLEIATEQLVAEGLMTERSDISEERDLLEEATRLAEEVRQAKPNP